MNNRAARAETRLRCTYRLKKKKKKRNRKESATFAEFINWNRRRRWIPGACMWPRRQALEIIATRAWVTPERCRISGEQARSVTMYVCVLYATRRLCTHIGTAESCAWVTAAHALLFIKKAEISLFPNVYTYVLRGVKRKVLALLLGDGWGARWQKTDSP